MDGKLPWFVEKMNDYDSEYYALIKEGLQKAISTTVLDEKTRYLILLALDTLKGAEAGVKVLAGQAREAGATEEEIKEAIRLAYFVSSMDVIKTSLNAWT
ncbi:MAG: carboxymuconolactone decarboxylase family protein [Syntrophomonadaceae bacterium]|nr:carboxymuconolactone decarboxylase family protein [Syntrophomonadaceae bacterium]